MSDIPTKGPDASPEVDRAALIQFRDLIFKHVDKTLIIPLRLFVNDKPVAGQVATNGKDIAPVISLAERGKEERGVFCPPLVATAVGAGGRAREKDIVQMPVLSVELDKQPGRGLDKLRQVLGPPTIVVRSGGKTPEGLEKLHAHWRLTRPAIQAEMNTVRACRRQMALHADGDRTAISPAHPLRWPGSIHCKGDPVMCLMTEINEDAEVDLEWAAEQLGTAVMMPSAEPEVKVRGRLLAPYPEDLYEAADKLPNDDLDWDEWSRIGMGFFNASAGSQAGWDAFLYWSSKSRGKFKEADCMERWDHWRTSPADDLGWPMLAGQAGIVLSDRAMDGLKALREARGLSRPMAGASEAPDGAEGQETFLDTPLGIQKAAEAAAGVLRDCGVDLDEWGRAGPQALVEWLGMDQRVEEVLNSGSAWNHNQDCFDGSAFAEIRGMLEDRVRSLQERVRDLEALPDDGDGLEGVLVDVERGVREVRERAAAEIQGRFDDVISDKSWMVDELPCAMMQEEAQAMMKGQVTPLPGIVATTLIFGAIMAGSRGWMIDNRPQPTPLCGHFLGLAPSGSGKGVCYKAASQWGNSLGACYRALTSETSLLNAMVEQDAKTPVSLVMDEAWSMYAGILQPGSHQELMLSKLTEIYGNSFGVMAGKGYADRKKNIPPIPNPNVVSFGLSTPGRFIDSMSDDFMHDGWMGRVTVVLDKVEAQSAADAREAMERVAFMQEAVTPPQGYAEALGWIKAIGRSGGQRIENGRVVEGCRVPHVTDQITGHRWHTIQCPRELILRLLHARLDFSEAYPSGHVLSSIAARAAERATSIAGALALMESYEACTMFDDPNPNMFEAVPPVIREAHVDYALKMVWVTLAEFGELYEHKNPTLNEGAQAAQSISEHIKAALAKPSLVKKKYRLPYAHGMVGIAHLFDRFGQRYGRRATEDAIAILETADVLGPEITDWEPGGPKRGRKLRVRKPLYSAY